jgi:integrase
MKLLILTGQRELEVTDAEWTEFDLDAGLWKIPAARTKKERAHLVHLAPQAVAILTELKKITGKARHVEATERRLPNATSRGAAFCATAWWSPRRGSEGAGLAGLGFASAVTERSKGVRHCPATCIAIHMPLSP